MRNYLRDLLLALADADVEFVLAGGVACVLHGVERMTLDLDLAIGMSPDNIRRFLSVMESEGLKPRVPVPGTVLMDPEHVRRIVEENNAVVFTFWDVDQPLRHVDVFLTEDHSFERLSTNAVKVDLSGRAIAIASIGKLIELKSNVSPPRDKDLADIEALRRLERGGRT